MLLKERDSHKKVRPNSLLILLLAGFLWVTGCQSKPQPDKRLLAELDQLRAENAQLKAEIDQLKTQLDNPVPELSPSPNSVTATKNSPIPVDFEDIKGVLGEKEITQLAQLGVFETTSGKFNRQAPITRAEFVGWLVRANNVFFAGSSDKSLRLPETDKATFSDVPSTHPDFPYIQGMSDAGFPIGFDDKTFKPDQILTREEMIAIKVALDHRVPLESYQGGPPAGWTDNNKLSKRYWSALYTESVFQNNANIGRTFGSIKTLNPQAPVKRFEAAVCISAIGDNVAGFTTAQEALQKLEQQNLP